MTRFLRHLGAAALLAGITLAGACSETPILVPLRSMERPKDVDFICLEEVTVDHWRGASLEKCAVQPDQQTPVDLSGRFHLHAVVTQMSRGELAVADIGTFPQDATALIKVDPRIPGYSFLPVGAVPTDVVADPGGQAVYVAGGRDARVDIIPAALLRGPIDTTAEQGDQSPWPHIQLDPTADGIAGALAIEREGNARRLYVMLPEAKPLPKVAVYDLGVVGDDPKGTPLAPPKVGDIPLDLTDAPPLPVAGLACGPNKEPAPWWVPYDQCFGTVTLATPPPVTAPPITEMHLAGIAVANGKIFAADDKAPIIHVFDVAFSATGAVGREERRIPVGSPLSRVSVSPAVPDEVDIDNQPGIDVCQERGWLGDGLDHTADSPTVAATLKGADGTSKCRLHRYVYGIDLFNPLAGNGSIAVVDVPITYPGGDRTKEQMDLAGASLVQAMACDSPSLPTTRIPLGPFGVGGANASPATGITFVTVDPPTPTTAIPAARCRAWNYGDQPTHSPELTPADGISEAARNARVTAGEFWRDGVGPGRLRGTFAFVALSNGAVAVVDIDDYDALCRGPKVDGDRTPGGLTVFEYPNVTPVPLGPFATGEYYSRPVQRHHPRSLRLFDATNLPSISTVTLSDPNGTLNNDPTNDTGKKRPHLAPMAFSGETPIFAIPSADNPFSIMNELWTITFEGQLPGFTGNVADIQSDGANLLLSDPGGAFCDRGVEDVGAAHDAVQLLDDTCPESLGCTDAVKDQCHQIFGDGTQFPLKPTRSLTIVSAFQDKLVLAQNGADLAKCFGVGTGHGPLLRYTVRASGSWVVVGSVTGYLHRRIVDPTSTDKACITDTTKSHVFDGRVRAELPSLAPRTEQSFTRTGLVSRTCDTSMPGQPGWFENPAWSFAIRSGTEPSVQGMSFSFASRFPWSPFSISAGQLPQSIKAINAQWDGQEQLRWNMIAIVDAVERGLYMVTAGAPLTFAKSVN